jgi:hypothetical protein
MRGFKVGVLAAVFSVSSLAACGGDDGSDDDSRGGTGGGGSAGSAGGGSRSCDTFKACGGDPVGEWTVKDVCFDNPGEVLAETLGGTCASAFKSTEVKGSGTYAIGADMQASSMITLTATTILGFNDACVKSLGLTGTAAAECEDLEVQFKANKDFSSATCAASGALCDCTLETTTKITEAGAYTIAGNTITVKGLEQAFCASGNTLTIQADIDGAEGSVVLTK